VTRPDSIQQGGGVWAGSAARLAWWLCGAALAMMLVRLVVVVLGRSAALPPGFPAPVIQAIEVIGFLGAPILGGVIAAHRPKNPYGWLWSAIGLSLGVSFLAFGYGAYALVVAPGALPGGVAAAWVSTVMKNGVAFGLLPFVFLLFPNGRLPSGRWRPVAWTAGLVGVALVVLVAVRPGPFYEFPFVDNPVRFTGTTGELIEWLFVGDFDQYAGTTGEAIERPLVDFASVVVLAWSHILLLSVVSMVVRFRRASGQERQQLKWFAAICVVLLGFFLALVFAPLAWKSRLWDAVLWAVLASAMYAAIGTAVLRHRLYDIDLLLSRTLVYGLLTVGGVGVYVGVVKSAEWLLRDGVGLGGSLLATAVIAVGFAPARDRLQRWVDRRLYGDRHDPVRAMARLGERLRDAPGGAPDGDALAGVLQAVCETLRLPWASLRVEDGVEVATFGRPGTASESIPLEHEGQPIGTLLVGVRAGQDALGVADRQVLEVLAAPVAVALHAVLLSQELQRSRERLVAAREEERRRLRRDLHDGLGPILTAVTLKADAARSAVATAPDRTDALLAELRGDANQAIGDLRRVIYDLRPAALDELGLLGALDEQVDRFGRQGLLISLQAPPALPVLPAAVEVATYRIVTEALTNVARHAHAHQVTITIAVDGELCLAVHDDGTTPTANGGGWRPGTGLQSMNERVAELGGTLEVGPTATGGRVQASLPLELA
jgi:two-component system, NarL family, sensor kinase